MTDAHPLSLDWEQIRLFLAVARAGSLAAAGARLGIDVSTVSRRLDKLEEHVGAPLFDRGREGATPTVLAESMMPHAEEMELAASRFSAASAQVETKIEGTVRLTVPPGIADLFVAPQLAKLRERHPDLVIELDASISYADLTRREADLALRATRPVGGDLVSTKLASVRAEPMASPAYAKALGKLERLEDARWITWGADLVHLPDAAWLRNHAPKVAPVLRTSHFASQLAAARTGLGAVIAPTPHRAVGLVAIAHAPSLDAAWAELPTFSLWLVGHRALRYVPRVDAVWRFLIEIIEAVVPRGPSRGAG